MWWLAAQGFRYIGVIFVALYYCWYPSTRRSTWLSGRLESLYPFKEVVSESIGLFQLTWWANTSRMVGSIVEAVLQWLWCELFSWDICNLFTWICHSRVRSRMRLLSVMLFELNFFIWWLELEIGGERGGFKNSFCKNTLPQKSHFFTDV